MRSVGLLSALPVLGAIAASDALADHWHHQHPWRPGGHLQFGIAVGPYWGAAVYPPPLYYHPHQIVVERPAPTIYIEQPAAVEAQYWYYCDEAKAYYPYVKDCPAGWHKVSPQP